jgi:hypothetical protein
MKLDIRLALHEAFKIEGVTYELLRVDGHDKPIYISKEGILGMNGEAISWGEVHQYEALAKNPDIAKAVAEYNARFSKNRKEKFRMN